MSQRNRTAGHNFEREIVNELKLIGFPEAVSARSESRNTDDQGIDVCNTLGYQFQCKNTVLNPNYHELITQMPQNGCANVIIHRKTKKAKSRFITQDDYVVLRKEEFFKLLQFYKSKNKT